MIKNYTQKELKKMRKDLARELFPEDKFQKAPRATELKGNSVKL